MSTSHLIIDTDAGSDDLMAIAFLLSRQDVQTEAITISNGLARVEQGARNVGKLLALSNETDIPVFIGNPNPLKGNRAFPTEWRRITEELPGIQLPNTYKEPEKESAIDFLRDRLQDKNRRVRFLALGPLTNIATVLQQEPPSVHGIDEIVIMGGAFEVAGNVYDVGEFRSPTEHVEWNLFIDPLATQIVFESGANLLVVPLDATNKAQINQEFLNEFHQVEHTRLGQFVGEILENVRHEIEEGVYYAWDPLAAVTLVEKNVVIDEEIFVEIETNYPDAGQTRRVDKGKYKARVACDADRDRFMKVFISAFSRK